MRRLRDGSTPACRLHARYAARVTSWIVFERSGLPRTEKRPWSKTMSASEASSMCAAIFAAFSRTRRAASTTAAPPTTVVRLP
jgi:hypothetical protein